MPLLAIKQYKISYHVLKRNSMFLKSKNTYLNRITKSQIIIYLVINVTTSCDCTNSLLTQTTENLMRRPLLAIKQYKISYHVLKRNSIFLKSKNTYLIRITKSQIIIYLVINVTTSCDYTNSLLTQTTENLMRRIMSNRHKLIKNVPTRLYKCILLANPTMVLALFSSENELSCIDHINLAFVSTA